MHMHIMHMCMHMCMCTYLILSIYLTVSIYLMCMNVNGAAYVPPPP